MLRAATLAFLLAACAQAPRADFPWVVVVECHVSGAPAAVRELEEFFRREVEAGRALPVAVQEEGGLRRWTYYVREQAAGTGAFADAVRLSGIEAATVAVRPGAD